MAKADEFVVGAHSPRGHIAFFEQDDATGYLYVCESDYTILHHLHIYNRFRGIHLRKKSVKVIWDSKCNRAGVLIDGVLRGVLGLNGDAYRPPMTSLKSRGVTKRSWIRGFESILNPGSSKTKIARKR